MNKPIIIIGASGHAKVIADMLLKSGEQLLGFLDDAAVGAVYGEYAVLGKVEACEKYADRARFIIGIGNNAVRRRIAEHYALDWATAVHPSAQIACSVTLGEGTVVSANAVINSDAVVGRHCIINTASVVEHDVALGDFVHLSSAVTLCGAVSVAKNTFIDAGTTVLRGIKIGADHTIGIGSVVTEDK